MTLGLIFALAFLAVFSFGLGGFSVVVLCTTLARAQFKAAGVALLCFFLAVGAGLYGWSLV